MMEWVFAMSTFRDEFGVWFLVMFISLFAGKVWGWIAEGRVEQLEQQAPNDPRLFHGRLVASLAIYVLFAAQMFSYSFDIVLWEARPGMTIMFVFEFAILCISAMTTCLRYVIWVQEHRIAKLQVTQAVEARKAEIRMQRQEAEEKLKANPEAEDAPNMADLPREEDVDENEIEAPGWEAKRGWLFALDIISGTRLVGFSSSWILTSCRSPQACSIHGVLHHPHCLLRYPHLYHPRSVHDHALFHQARLRLSALPSRHQRHGYSISQRNRRRPGRRQYLYCLPRGDATS